MTKNSYVIRSIRPDLRIRHISGIKTNTSLCSKVNRTRLVKEKELRHKMRHYLLRLMENGTIRHDKTKVEKETDTKRHGETEHNYILSSHHLQSTSFVNVYNINHSFNYQHQRVSRSRTSKQMVRFNCRGHMAPTTTSDLPTSRVQMKSRKEVRNQVSIGTPLFAKTHRTEQCEDLSTEEYSDRSASSGPSLARQRIFFSEYPVARHTWKVSDCAIPGDYVSCINVINHVIMIVYSAYVYTK